MKLREVEKLESKQQSLLRHVRNLKEKSTKDEQINELEGMEKEIERIIKSTQHLQGRYYAVQE